MVVGVVVVVGVDVGIGVVVVVGVGAVVMVLDPLGAMLGLSCCGCRCCLCCREKAPNRRCFRTWGQCSEQKTL